MANKRLNCAFISPFWKNCSVKCAAAVGNYSTFDAAVDAYSLQRRSI